MPISLDKLSYGVELELGNSYRFCRLPEGASWNDKDNTCVSSNGIANDPLGKLYEFGGEINTKPTYSISEQINHISEIYQSLTPAPVINYRSNLHIHVRVPGLKDDLEMCKVLLKYVDKYQQEAFDVVENIPLPPNKQTVSKEEYDGHVKRYNRRKKSHQYKLPDSRVEPMLNAKTTQEFYEEHAPATEKGRMWYFSPRAGINLRQIWEETETIEFRHFPGTLDVNEIEACIWWCQTFINAAFSKELITPKEFPTYGKFPEFQPYEFKTEEIYQWTNVDKNSRKEVAERLVLLKEKIDINDLTVPSSQMYDVMQEIKGISSSNALDI